MATVDQFIADFHFRGHREYVHSASICNELAAHFGRWEKLDLVLKQWMTHAIAFQRVETLAKAEGPLAGHARITIDGEDQLWTLREDLSRPVVERRPYDEDALVAADPVENGALTSRPGGGGSFYDRLIAANKKLINVTLNPGVKLIAARVALRGFPDDDDAFTLEVSSNIGVRIFKSQLLLGGVASGDIVYYGQ